MRPPPSRSHDPRHRAYGDAKALEESRERPSMLPGITNTARGEHGEHVLRRRRRAPLMRRDGGRLVDDVVADVADPLAQILVFAVEEEPLVEAVEPLEDRPAHHEAGARDPIGRRTPRVVALPAHELVGPR